MSMCTYAQRQAESSACCSPRYDAGVLCVCALWVKSVTSAVDNEQMPNGGAPPVYTVLLERQIIGYALMGVSTSCRTASKACLGSLLPNYAKGKGSMSKGMHVCLQCYMGSQAERCDKPDLCLADVCNPEHELENAVPASYDRRV